MPAFLRRAESSRLQSPSLHPPDSSDFIQDQDLRVVLFIVFWGVFYVRPLPDAPELLVLSQQPEQNLSLTYMEMQPRGGMIQWKDDGLPCAKS